ncbi:response regulator transcription factor [Pseudomonas sp. TWR3-1-1]|uniref:response regulator transcription factor n=1 Tax=Pseudomonas sp. TWR3-1-1 TaxID=2804633 RepID=UPI003CFADE0E
MNPVVISPSRLLAIEDDPVLGAYLHEQLQRSGFEVVWCQNGQQGLALAQHEHFDVVLMDILLPGMNGLHVLTQLRQTHALPVILMSALGAEADRINGFQLGADDYLPKPFSMAELEVRIAAILRRVALDRTPRTSVLSVSPAVEDELFMDDSASDVRYGAQWAGLTRSEYRLLDTLNRHGDEVLSKAFLYQHVLQRGYAPHDRSLDMHISQIRRKLKTLGYHAREVRTVWGKGYVLSANDAL